MDISVEETSSASEAAWSASRLSTRDDARERAERRTTPFVPRRSNRIFDFRAHRLRVALLKYITLSNVLTIGNALPITLIILDSHYHIIHVENIASSCAA
eukprot:3957149-Pleurochrysis_carterae.AAC.2